MMQRPVLIRVFGFVVFGALLTWVGLGQGAAAAEGSFAGPISVVWIHSSDRQQQTLKSFTDAELKAMASRSARSSGKQGPLLSSVLDAAMKDLSAEAKSQIDLVVLHGEAGNQAWIPRALVTRSSLMLALPERDSVVPVSSHSRLQSEEL
ncbi:hypothetical protein EBZ37_12345, partial [bacterium]|nr:hypothetical protein [bacterium]